MSNFTIEILEPTINFIEIETSFLDTVTDNLEIERFDSFNLEIVNTEKILWSDLPDNIPMSKISGNLPASRIEGLAEYLSSIGEIHVNNVIGLDDYLDAYEFDCGTP
jgi:hypothetical protein